jgi:hypothetical protein
VCGRGSQGRAFFLFGRGLHMSGPSGPQGKAAEELVTISPYIRQRRFQGCRQMFVDSYNSSLAGMVLAVVFRAANQATDSFFDSTHGMNAALTVLG